VRDINAWWTRTLHEEQGLENFLEIEFDTHYKKFFMPTIRVARMWAARSDMLA
jgi:DNA polymerase-2